MKRVPVQKFGKDHWSLLAFVEILCVDHKGAISDVNRQRMRTNIKRHPGHGYFPLGTEGHEWKKDWGTRLRGYFEKRDSKLRLNQHDDWDCLEDFENAGLLENKGSGLNPVLRLTPLGKALAARLRVFKQDGGQFAYFAPTEAEAVAAVAG